MRATAEELLLWEQRIEDRTRSGMTVDEWCKKNEVSRHKYYYWNHQISKKQSSNKEVTFAEVTPIISNSGDAILGSAKSDDFKVFFKNIQVTVPSNFNQDSLAGLMKVLQQL